MSQVRQNFSPKAVTSLVLWSSSSYSVENLQKLEKEEKDANVKKYLGCLIAYKSKLKENNPCYDNAKESADVTQFLKKLTELKNNKHVIQNNEFIVAVYNFLGLTYRWLNQYAESLNLFSQAISLATNPIAKAILYSHMGDVLYINIPFLEYQKDAVKFLKIVDQKTADDETKQTVAAVYAELAGAYRKTNLVRNAEIAEKTFDKALQWWDSNVIANRRAILLSKINTEATLQRAEEYFKTVYDYAKTNSHFVVPYYRADVVIKLAGICIVNGLTAQADVYIESAREYLTCAEKSLMLGNYGNATDLSDYQNKGLARIHKLNANLAFIQGHIELAEQEKEKAKKYRSAIKEEDASTEKFIKGLVNTKSPFQNVAVLFRYKMKPSERPVEIVASSSSMRMEKK